MIWALVSELMVAMRLRKAAPLNSGAPSDVAAGEDIVARHGLSHASEPDPVSRESQIEIERQKNFRPSPR